MTSQIGLFVVVTIFSCFSSKESHDFPLKRNAFSLFFNTLLLLLQEKHTLSKMNHAIIKMNFVDLLNS